MSMFCNFGQGSYRFFPWDKNPCFFDISIAFLPFIFYVKNSIFSVLKNFLPLFHIFLYNMETGYTFCFIFLWYFLIRKSFFRLKIFTEYSCVKKNIFPFFYINCKIHTLLRFIHFIVFSIFFPYKRNNSLVIFKHQF